MQINFLESKVDLITLLHGFIEPSGDKLVIEELVVESHFWVLFKNFLAYCTLACLYEVHIKLKHLAQFSKEDDID